MTSSMNGLPGKRSSWGSVPAMQSSARVMLQPGLGSARFHNDKEQLMDTALTPPLTLAKKAKTPFPGKSDAYRTAREALLAEEIEFRRAMTRLVEQRRALP